MKRNMKRNGVENCPNNGMPVCQYYLEGRCNSDSCPYRHINVGSDAQICRHFNRGFCPNGDQCKRKHLFVVRKRDKTKTKTRLKSSKSVGQSPQQYIKSNKNCSQSETQCLTEQSLPQFIAISNANDNNFKSDSNPFVDNNCQQISEQSIEQTFANNTYNKNNRKDKYFWLESDEEISIENQSTQDVSTLRPPIAIVPKFLL